MICLVLMDPAVFWKVCKIKTLITVVFMSTNSVLAMNTKKIWIDVEKNQFYLRHSDRALKILKIRHFDKKMNEKDRFYNIVCKDFLHSSQLDFSSSSLGYLPSSFFQAPTSQAMHANFSVFLLVKSTILELIFW